ncbi:2Fe-2S iron-sulfur cluster-binding protein [Paenibacillus cremeus]|uniref:(2Fe-2S)-binding protein n=1 Tax=Paenibacillus cremeus TaxID=2163881 RepID=A0A559KHK7_9BACL|nr:2Fe-2S iron-sulfur cluster-binding protein [Paenibacillus cremeus]TVY11601.1 (2Fe-2S)-binding protein [Paenibacillus cremeus]
MITLAGRRVNKTVEPVKGFTILDMALKHEVDWGFSCMRGTCSRCRCLVTKGMEHLSEVSEEELDALEPEEIEEGYRLGCQAKIRSEGEVSVTHKPYF